MNRFVKLAAAALAAISLATATVAPSFAASGTVRLRIAKAGFIVGVGGGDGVLHFQGRAYRLSVGGLALGSLGVAAVDFVGTAANLHRAADIAGTYAGAGAGLTVVGGAQVVTLQNQNGVVLTLRGAQAGFQASLGVGGMTIALR